MISAYIVIGQNSYTAPPVHGHEGKGTTDNFQVEAKIWTAYSKDRKEHFYLVNLGFIAYVEPSLWRMAYQGQYSENERVWLLPD